MKIALVQCPVWGTGEPPLSIIQLSACLKSKGHEVKSFDLNNYLYKSRKENYRNLWAWEQSVFWYRKENILEFFGSISGVIQRFINNVISYNPSGVGFSISASSYYSTIVLAQMIKDKKKDIKVMFGGQIFYISNNIQQAFKESCVDYIIPGEGDMVLPDILTLLENSNDISQCRGIYFKNENAVKFTGERKPLANLDKLPYMDYNDLRIEDYDNQEHITLMTSRGCVWKCAFCSSRSFWKGYREMSAERIHQEISFHKIDRPNIGHIDFQDLLFNANVKRLEEFCSLMIKYPPFGGRMLWLANTIINPKMTKDTFRLMVQSGCKKVIFGIESGSQRVLDMMGKSYQIKDAKEVIKNASEAGIRVTGNFMFGFPGETEEDFQKTLDFIKETGQYFERVYPSRTYCALEEGSELYNYPSKYGIVEPFSHHLYWETKDGKNKYPVRLKRCQTFEELCSKLNLHVDCGVKISVELDEWFNLGNYYEYEKDYKKALEYFDKYYRHDSKNEIVIKKREELRNKCLNL